MWCLVPPTGDTPYELTSNKVHCVGRKAGDIILNTDGSVSREHAKIEVRLDGVYVSDMKSKFGTYIDEGIPTNTKLVNSTLLTEGGQVRFGLQNNIWTLKRNVPYVFFDMLKGTEKSEIVSILSRIGGKVHHEWAEDTSHLSTNSLRLTHEVLCALASAKPIVLPTFWQQYLLMISGKAGVPNPSKYIPPVGDKRLLSERASLCLPNTARKTLFKDKLFVFSSPLSYKVHRFVVELAGGKAIKLSESKLALEDFCQPHVVVLSCSGNEQSPLYKKILQKFLEKSYRVIPEDDIGLSLWKTSVSVHCNPKYSVKNILHKPQESHSEEDMKDTLVMDTQDISAISTGVELTSEVIPPTLSENLFSTEDRTLSLSIRPIQSQTSSVQSGPKDNCGERLKTGKPCQNTFKKDQHSLEEEDMFAFEDDFLKKRSSNTCTFGANTSRIIEKRKSSAADDDNNDFSLPSPPRRKKTKLSANDIGEDAFNLPAEPVSKKVQSREAFDEELNFLDSAHTHQSTLLNKTNKSSTFNESRDLFTQESVKNPPTAKIREKRKDTVDFDFETPPAKRPHSVRVGVTDVHHVSSCAVNSDGWICLVKKKELADEEEELVNAFHTTAVVTPLMRKPKQDNVASTSATFSGRNFKKFRKVWSGTSEKLYLTTSPVQSTYGRGRAFGNGINSAGEDHDHEEDEDDLFAAGRSTPRGRVSRQSEDEDDEFALPSYSQV